MDINPLFKLFTQYSHYVKLHNNPAEVYLHITRMGIGHVSIIDNGESITPFSWETLNEGMHQFRTQIANAKAKLEDR